MPIVDFVTGMRSALALIALAMVAAGCATPGAICNIRDDWHTLQPIPERGHLVITWEFNAPRQGANNDGITFCYSNDVCQLYLKEPPPRFDDVCALARFGHELAHGVGGRHE